MAGGQERILRGRIKAMQSTKKITRAMELIAGARIVKAQQRLNRAVPYTRELYAAISAAADTVSPSCAWRRTSSRHSLGVIPSGPTFPTPSASCSSRPDTRISKNSSRIDVEIVRPACSPK